MALMGAVTDLHIWKDLLETRLRLIRVAPLVILLFQDHWFSLWRHKYLPVSVFKYTDA